MRLASPLLLIAITLLHLAVASDAAPSAPRYTLTDLGALPGGQNSTAYAINNQGWVVGWADDIAEVPAFSGLTGFGGNLLRHAVLWQNGQAHDLGSGVAFGINDRGQVVCGLSQNGLSLLDGSHTTILAQNARASGEPTPHLVGAMAINIRGQVAGIGARSFTFYPALWRVGVLTALPLPVGDTSDTGIYLGDQAGELRDYVGGAINAQGDVVGTTTWLDSPHVYYHAVLWRAGRVTLLGELSPLEFVDGGIKMHDSRALAINDREQVVGVSNGKAFLWERGKMRGLPPLIADRPMCEAFAVNGRGWAVGTASTLFPGQPNIANHSARAVMWRDEAVYDLNALIAPDPHWVLERAYGINDRGQIVGEGQKGGHPCAFLLTPADNTK